MKYVLILVIPLILIGSLPVSADTNNTKQLSWIDRGKEAVKSKLKDPYSAEFRNVYFFRGAQNIPVACGEVNSRNSYGGYSGFQKFVSGGDTSLTFLESEVSDFANVWEALCK